LGGRSLFGCSLDAAFSTIKPLGYFLVALEYDNTLFVDCDNVTNTFRDSNAKKLMSLDIKMEIGGLDFLSTGMWIIG